MSLQIMATATNAFRQGPDERGTARCWTGTLLERKDELADEAELADQRGTFRMSSGQSSFPDPLVSQIPGLRLSLLGQSVQPAHRVRTAVN